MKIILIFEPLSGGHRANYFRWLSEWLEVQPMPSCRFVFVVSPKMACTATGSVVVHRISAETSRRLEASGRWKKRWLLYQLFWQACQKYSPDHALILELTHLELPLALFGSPVPLSAILFVQYPELPRGLKFFSKHWETALLLCRAPVRNLFLFNGEYSCNWLTGRFGSRARFIPIPDPAPAIEAAPEFVMRNAYGIEPTRKIFLFFGAISPRKGADVLIKALHQLPPAAAAKSAFVFCGEPEWNYQQAFQQACAGLRAARPDLSLNIEPGFVSDEQMMALFEHADVVLMPYARPEYSSGILALAAKAKTPVIGPDAGLLGRLIRENGLGAVCAIFPEPLAKQIARAVEKFPDIDGARREAFVQRSHPGLFAQTILDAVCNEC